MADHHHHPIHTTKAHFQQKDKYSTPKVLAVLTLFPIGGLCFLLSSLILTGTLIGLTIAIPLFFIFSPVLVPAVLTAVLIVTGLLTSGGFGITALSSLAYILNYFRKMSGGTRGRGGSVAGYVGQKGNDMGQWTREMVRP